MAQQASGAVPAQLRDAPELPLGGRHVWQWFIELHNVRGGNGFGPMPIGYREIRDWAEMSGVHVEPWELRAIVAIDRAFLAEEQA